MRRDASFLASQYFGYVFPYTRPLYCDAEPSLACISTFFYVQINVVSVTYFHIRAQNFAWASLVLLASWCFFIISLQHCYCRDSFTLFFDVFFMQFIFGYVFPYTCPEHRVGEHKPTCILMFF